MLLFILTDRPKDIYTLRLVKPLFHERDVGICHIKLPLQFGKFGSPGSFFLKAGDSEGNPPLTLYYISPHKFTRYRSYMGAGGVREVLYIKGIGREGRVLLLFLNKKATRSKQQSALQMALGPL